MKKKLSALIMIVALALACTACTNLGKWIITDINAGDVKMNQDDIDNMGMEDSFIKLNKSGSCIINLFGDEYQGDWVEAEDGTISIKYGDDMNGTATIKDGVMTFTDVQGTVYTARK